MKDKKIIEIFQKLNDRNWYNQYDLTGTCWVDLTWEEAHYLIDYFNILQDENKILRKNENLINNELKECRHYKVRVKHISRYMLENFTNDDCTFWNSEIEKIYNYLNK